MHWYKYSSSSKDYICKARSKLIAEIKVRMSDVYDEPDNRLVYKGCVANEKIENLKEYASVVILE